MDLYQLASDIRRTVEDIQAFYRRGKTYENERLDPACERYAIEEEIRKLLAGGTQCRQ